MTKKGDKKRKKAYEKLLHGDVWANPKDKNRLGLVIALLAIAWIILILSGRNPT